MKLEVSKPSVEELKTVIALSDLPNDQLQWILDNGEYREYDDGEVLVKTGEPIDDMYFLIEGSVSYYMDMNGQLVHFFTFENDTRTGGVSGLLPYSRMKASLGTSYTVGHVRAVALHKSKFHELEELNPDLITRLVAYMTDRARHFATLQLQKEKVNALGQLAAGIAHELNNPAAAINRIAVELQRRLKQNYELTQNLLIQNINQEHIKKIRDMMTEKEMAPKEKLSTLQKMDREDELNDWLKDNNFKENRLAGESFSEAGFTSKDFETILGNVGSNAFSNVIEWLENLIISQRLMKDLDDASCRISTLVGAIKSHVHMDRTNELQKTNLQQDIENTLTLLGYKIREKNISIKRKFAENLPPIDAFIGELNQVWTNLIDNSIFALGEKGELRVETSCTPNQVKVCIIDNGSGIPKEILSRVFDPFFTTKKVGQGTGIGLDLVQRIVKKHNGEIKVTSIPGNTEFSITLPITQTDFGKS